MNMTCEKQCNECQVKKDKLILQLIDHIYVLANRTISLKSMVYSSAYSYCAVFITQNENFNLIPMNIKKSLVF